MNEESRAELARATRQHQLHGASAIEVDGAKGPVIFFPEAKRNKGNAAELLSFRFGSFGNVAELEAAVMMLVGARIL